MAVVGRGAHARPVRRAPRGRSGRLVTVALSVLLLAGALIAIAAHRDAGAAPDAAETTTTTSPALLALATTATTVPGPPPGSAPLRLLRVIGGPISPKSVDATDTGLVFAQNMMYRHTMTVYALRRRAASDDPRLGRAVALRHPGPPGRLARRAGRGSRHPGPHATCGCPTTRCTARGSGPRARTPARRAPATTDGYTDSYLYRVSLETLRIDGVAKVGWVPKYVAVTPTGRWVLATNWCSYDLSIVSTATLREVARHPDRRRTRGASRSRRTRGSPTSRSWAATRSTSSTS